MARKIQHSLIRKRSIAIREQKTSVSIEDAFWNRLVAHAEKLGVPINRLIEQIDAQRTHANLSSAVRLFVLEECGA